MSLPPCALLDEAIRLDVGRGVALVELEARLAKGAAPCSIDARAALSAREEGRSAPEPVAFAIDVDGRLERVGGPRGVAAIELAKGAKRVRVRAVLAGDRFVATPLALEPLLDARVTSLRVSASTTWARFATFATVRWVDRGVPALATIDPTRDREPLAFTRAITPGEAATIVVDAGAMMADRAAPTIPIALGRGGALALSAILVDAPLAIATAPDAVVATARVRDAADVALAAARAPDPLLAALGQRLASGLARGFEGCRREAGSVPPTWPAPPPALADAGLLDDDEAGCARVEHLLRANLPEFALAREGRAALLAALRDGAQSPAIAPLFPRTGPLGATDAARRAPRGARRSHAPRLLLALAAAVAALAMAWLMRRSLRETL